jgi:ion channel
MLANYTALTAALLFTLRTSRARRIGQLLAVIYLLTGTVSALASALAPSAGIVGQWATLAGGLLLIVTPFVILRRVGAHRVVTTETVLGAICVYLLIGFSFAFIYSAVSNLDATPFFEGQQSVLFNEYLFFSYTTLTTVAYGNFVPAGNLGQTLAMLETLSGQIYLVIVVARLVSLRLALRPVAPSP